MQRLTLRNSATYSLPGANIPSASTSKNTTGAPECEYAAGQRAHEQSWQKSAYREVQENSGKRVTVCASCKSCTTPCSQEFSRCVVSWTRPHGPLDSHQALYTSTLRLWFSGPRCWNPTRADMRLCRLWGSQPTAPLSSMTLESQKAQCGAAFLLSMALGFFEFDMQA